MENLLFYVFSKNYFAEIFNKNMYFDEMNDQNIKDILVNKQSSSESTFNNKLRL